MLSSLCSSKGIVDLQPLFFHFTLATTTALIFGEPVGTLGNDATNTFGSAFDYASLISAMKIRLADFHWAYTPKKFTKSCDIVRQYATHFVTQALKDQDERGELARQGQYAFILDLYKDLQDTALVRDQLVHVLLAGRDTTACLMSWAL